MSKIKLELNDTEAHIIFDNEDGKANIFDTQTLEELEAHIETLEKKALKRLYVSSAKDGIFIAGADIKQLFAITEKADAVNAAQTGQRIFQRLANLKCLKIALIDGACMGGGLELTLACDIRIASNSSKTKLALPEVQLGILPAWGGTTRIPNLLRFDKALDLLLTGKRLDGKRALKVGLVQACCPPDSMMDVAKSIKIENKKSMMHRIMDLGFVRNYALKKAHKSVYRSTRNNYPAPLKILAHLGDGANRKHETSLEAEATALGELAVSSVCKSLIQLYFNKEAADKDKAWQEKVDKLPSLQNLGTLGAGIMGGGIAHLAAKRGYDVRMRDISVEGLNIGMKAANDLVGKELKRRRIKKDEATKRIARVTPVLDMAGFKHVDLAIEAIVENMDIKKKALAELEGIMSEDSIIASNTSSLSITEMATALKRPENFIGMHFFNPVDKMPLVEVIRGDKSSDRSVAAIVELSQKLGKTPVVVKDGPGFLVNRLLAPYMNEALRLVEEGIHPEFIDEALLDYGMPMGPCHLVDEVGVDVANKVAHILEEGLGTRMKGSAIADELVEQGKLGRKTGEGFYNYAEKRKVAAARFTELSWEGDAEKIQIRCLLPMWNEAIRCLDEEVVASPEELDLAMILGTGYAPFRGGPFSSAKTIGWDKVKELLLEHQQQHGDRFTPADCIDKFIK